MNQPLSENDQNSGKEVTSSQISEQFELITDVPVLQQFLDAIPVPVLVLNTQRHNVYSNKALLQITGENEMQTFYGRRVGEILNCIHAFQKPAGCGSTESCTTCGAMKTIISAQDGNQDFRETRILTKENTALDLRVYASPLKIAEENFTIFTVTDISDEKRRKNLERIFFHDLLNTASSLKAIAYNLETATYQESEEFRGHLVNLSDKLVDEICTQRDIYAAENHELTVYLSRCNSFVLMNDVFAQFNLYYRDKKIVINNEAANVEFFTDKILIRRILSNMLKNALEANYDGIVTIDCRVLDNNNIEFSVHNPGYIERDIQLQIFQRSFTTKGFGRGVGTYSMKLLTENYLNGKVFFNSSETEGTTFYCRIPMNVD